MDNEDAIELMQRMLDCEGMIKHLVDETNFNINDDMAGATQKECEAKHVSEYQVRNLLKALAENTDFTLYT